jgi:hypothetical protein
VEISDTEMRISRNTKQNSTVYQIFDISWELKQRLVSSGKFHISDVAIMLEGMVKKGELKEIS